MKKKETIIAHKAFYTKAYDMGYIEGNHYYYHEGHNGYLFNGRYLYYPKKRLAREVGSPIVTPVDGFEDFENRYVRNAKSLF